MSDLLSQLNSIQKQAVTQIEGPVMVIAGPGSGKTRVLTYRIAYMIQQGIPPHQILALTFTNKAAREMTERIENGVNGRVSGLWAGTFHSLFARILRFEAKHIGYPSQFTIYDTDDSKSLIRSIVKEMNLKSEDYPANQILSRISSLKSNLITPRTYEQDEKLMTSDRIGNRRAFHKIYSEYVARCKQAGAMDFDDLLYRLYELFQRFPEILAKYRQRFRYILVDEFQDTNFLQYAIIRKLTKYKGSPENICIVGDDAQSIYAFRGATIENILDFERDFKSAKVFKLEQNYRSTPYIVAAANDVISRNKRQIKKTIWTSQDEGQKIKVIKTVSDNEEGKRIADLILEHKNRYHVSNSEIAILYRTNAQSRVFEDYLRRYNIPYRIYGGLSFYQRKEIKDLLAYLRLVINPSDEEAFKRVVNYPRRGIGSTTLDAIMAHRSKQDTDLFTAAQSAPLPPRARGQLNKFLKIIQNGVKKNEEKGAYEAAEYLANASGIIKSFKDENTTESLGRLENIEALLNGIRNFMDEDEVSEMGIEADDRSLADFIQHIALLTDQDNDNADSDRITLMSVHSAKGLEFDAIFLVGLEENLFPSFMSMESDKDIDEERRLFYVAITRARKHLTLSYATSRYRFGKVVYNRPSRFLEDIDQANYDNPSVVFGRPFSMEESQPGTAARIIPPKRKKEASRIVPPKDFTPAQASEIEEGMEVFHLKFGKGKVLKIDGQNDSRVATIHFPDIDSPQRRIMLKFAKLQIVESIH